MKRLTKRQKQVLAFLRRFQASHDRLPSSRDIQKQFGWKSQTASINHLKALTKKKEIRRDGRHYKFARKSR